MRPKPQVWITGLGTVSCLGPSVKDLWTAVTTDHTGIKDGLGRIDDGVLTGNTDNRALSFALHSAREALKAAGWKSMNSDDGLIVATTTGFFLQWDRAFKDFIAKNISLQKFRHDFMNQPLMQVNVELARAVNHHGPSTLVTSACSASTQALGLGAMWIRQGRVKRCLIVGVEVLCDLTMEGFRSLQLLSVVPSTPFDINRRGINLSEGAASLCLEGETSGLARLRGFGFSTDAFHMTGPHPEGDGSYRAMRQALQTSGIDASEITWVHAHGTGSQQNDLSEGLAIKRLCGDHQPYVSSSKWTHGHSLGASGALESVIVIKSFEERKILRTRGLSEPDPRIPVRHPQKDESIVTKHVLKNTLGFGGSNASVIFSHPRAVES